MECDESEMETEKKKNCKRFCDNWYIERVDLIENLYNDILFYLILFSPICWQSRISRYKILARQKLIVQTN